MKRLNGERNEAFKIAKDLMSTQMQMDAFYDSPAVVKNNEIT